MKFRFIWVGRTRDKSWKTLQDEYLQRLSHFVRTEITEIKDASGRDAVELEGAKIIAAIPPRAKTVLLDVKGRTIDSFQLARQIEAWQNDGIAEIAFMIGGAHGVSSAVAEMADDRLSLSFLTFTHEMARVVLLEQLYRAFTIIKGFPYQK